MRREAAQDRADELLFSAGGQREFAIRRAAKEAVERSAYLNYPCGDESVIPWCLRRSVSYSDHRTAPTSYLAIHFVVPHNGDDQTAQLVVEEQIRRALADANA